MPYFQMMFTSIVAMITVSAIWLLMSFDGLKDFIQIILVITVLCTGASAVGFIWEQ